MKRIAIGAGVLIGLAIVVGALLLVANLLRTDEPDISSSLRRPNPGEVRPDYLADGTPVCLTDITSVVLLDG